MNLFIFHAEMHFTFVLQKNKGNKNRVQNKMN